LFFIRSFRCIQGSR